jgi:hypothetical protein
MSAGGMFDRIDRKALPGVGLKPRLAMARQAFLVSGSQSWSRSQSQSQTNQNNRSRAHFTPFFRNSTAC